MTQASAYPVATPTNSDFTLGITGAGVVKKFSIPLIAASRWIEGTYAEMLAVVTPATNQLFMITSGNWQGLFRYDGAKWLPYGGGVRTFTDPATFTGAADTALNLAKQVVIPAGWMGTKGYLQITAHSRHTSSANLKTYALQFGGQVLGYSQTNGVGCFGYEYRRRVWNANSASAQVAMGLGTRSFAQEEDNPERTATVDTTVNQTIAFSIQKDTADESISIDGFMLELYPS